MRTRRFLVLFLWNALLSVPALRAETPLAGLDSLYPWPEEATNLIQNPSFESAAAGKPTGWTVNISPNLYRDGSQRFHGSFSLRFKNTHLASGTPNASQRPALADGWYTIRARVRAIGAGSNDSNSGGRLNMYGSGGTTPVVRGTTSGWSILERRDVPVLATDSARLRLEAYRKPNGNIWFDQVELRRQKPPAVEAFLLYPNYRGALFDDRSQIVQVQVQARPAEMGMGTAALKVRLRLETTTGTLIATSEGAAPLTPATWTLSAAAAPRGELILRIQGLQTSNNAIVFEHPPYRLVKMAGADRVLLDHWVDSDNVAVLNGRRRFVLGIYDTTSSSADVGFWEPRIAKIAEAPLDLYLNYWQSAVSDGVVRAVAQTLRRHGMAYLHTVNNWFADDSGFSNKPSCGGRTSTSLGEAGYASCRASALGDEPGLAGWYTADERSAERVPRIFGQYRALRTSDPGSLTFVAQHKTREFGRWRDAVDVLGVDPYPIQNVPETTVSPLDKVSDWVTQAQAAVAARRPVWAVIQYWKAGLQGHFPTEDELRSMSYLAIVSGAKGLFYWSYGAVGLSSVTDPALREEYWQRLVRVTTEIRSLEAALLSAEAPSVIAASTSSAEVRRIARRVGTTRYIIAVNNTSRAGVTATFDLAAAAVRISVVGESREVPRGSRISDTFGPFEAHVYRID